MYEVAALVETQRLLGAPLSDAAIAETYAEIVGEYAHADAVDRENQLRDQAAFAEARSGQA